jgi:hypothetical protein
MGAGKCFTLSLNFPKILASRKSHCFTVPSKSHILIISSPLFYLGGSAANTLSHLYDINRRPLGRLQIVPAAYEARRTW